MYVIFLPSPSPSPFANVPCVEHASALRPPQLRHPHPIIQSHFIHLVPFSINIPDIVTRPHNRYPPPSPPNSFESSPPRPISNMHCPSLFPKSNVIQYRYGLLWLILQFLNHPRVRRRRTQLPFRRIKSVRGLTITE